MIVRNWILIGIVGILTACSGDSCDQGSRQDYASVTFLVREFQARWVVPSAIGMFSELAETDLGQAYSADGIHLAVVIDKFQAFAKRSKNIHFSLFNQAMACSPVPTATPGPRTLDSELQTLEITTLNPIGNAFEVGDDVGELFMVVKSTKFETFDGNQVSLEEFNGLPVPNERAYSEGEHVDTVLALVDSNLLTSGDYQFTITATLEDGSIFIFDTNEISIMN